MVQGEISVTAYFPREGAAENKGAATYWDKIRPTLMTAEEYFATVESKEEWLRRHEEKALTEHFGVQVKVKIRGAA